MPTLEITTMVGCPLRCTFCPQDELTKAYGDNERCLSLDNFKSILSKVPDYVRIDFSGMSEPWANTKATSMLRHTLAKGYNVAIYTTLVGMTDYVDVVHLLKMHEKQVETVVVHLPDQKGNMRGFKNSTKYKDALREFKSLAESWLLRRIEFMTMEAGGKALATDLPIVPWSANRRAGTVDLDAVGEQPIEDEVRHEKPLCCSFTPFYDHNVLLPNGDVYLCCMDYTLKHKIGNLLTDNYFDLFVSEGMNLLHRENMQFGYRESTICRKCTRARLYDNRPEDKQFWRKPIMGGEVSAEPS